MNDRTKRFKRLFDVSLPLVFSMAATTVMEFTDRVFLANYALEAIAAALPAGIAAFLVLTLFTGITGYLNVFVAQYTGAGDHRQVGRCLWQGIYFSLFAAAALAGVSLGAAKIFQWGGHPPEVQALERAYFRILCLGGGVNVLGTCLASFFTGRGQTRPVLLINCIGMAVNIPLDYALINGVWIFPELGIRGAGLATVCAWAVIALLFAGLIFERGHERRCGVLSQRAFDAELFARIIRKGVPAALQFTLDVLAFTFFVFMVGRLGKTELAVSNIALSIQSIAFMPAFGFSMGLSTLVGQALGRDDPAAARRFTRQTIYVLLTYTMLLGAVFFLFPNKLLALFGTGDVDSATRLQLVDQGVVVLRIMALFIAFDALYFTFVGALKGAGDTRFIMTSIGLATLFVMVLPLTAVINLTDWGLYACWINLTLYVLTLFAVSFWRYRQGRWRDIRVI